MISANEFKAGMVIRWKDDLYQVLQYQHVKMQQRAPIIRTKLVKLGDGSMREEAFRSGDKFEEVYVERKELQYQYKDGDVFHLMDINDYHDITINEKIIGEKKVFLKENDIITGVYCDDSLINIELPASVVMKVIDTEPGFRGDTAKSGNKPATIETGAIVKVPLFVVTGDAIRVDTRTGDYIERA